MGKLSIDGIDGLKAAEGSTLGPSDWMEITQDRVQQFADATDDQQWIHVDPEMAREHSPFGGPIAHGFLTLSLASAFLPSLVDVTGISMGVNYGLNKVRFPAPVPVGANLRIVGEIAEVVDAGPGVQVTYNLTFEVEGQDKPACVAEFLARYYP